MSPADLSRLVLLGALWGASFLFMRMGAGEFGPLALVFVRVAGAALLLMPLVLLRGEADDLTTLAQKAAAGSVTFRLPEGRDATRAMAASRRAVAAGMKQIDRQRVAREKMIARVGDAPSKPWIYLIVATGDIHEDIPQAQAAAH